MFDDDIVVWRERNLRVLDRRGAIVWEVDFAQRVTEVEVVRDTIACVAGPLVVFTSATNQGGAATA
jgi:hypothetical protein